MLNIIFLHASLLAVNCGHKIHKYICDCELNILEEYFLNDLSLFG